jgi:hypothetical protein
VADGLTRVVRRCWRTSRAPTLSALVFVALVVLTLGLASRSPIGIMDNFDGWRSFDAAGLVPAEPDGQSAGKGYVVTRFSKQDTQRYVEGRDAGLLGTYYPNFTTFSLLAIREGVPGTIVDLRLLALIWALTAAIVLYFSWTEASKANVIIGFLILSLSPFSRFFVSTYADHAALIGLVGLLTCLPLVARRHKNPSVAGYLVCLLSAVLVAGSKAAYFPIVLIAVVVTLVGFFRNFLKFRVLARVALCCVTALSVICSMRLVQANLSSQDRKNSQYVNDHNFVMTVAGPSFGVDWLESRGVDSSLAAESLGEAFWPRSVEWQQFPSWFETIGDPKWSNRIRIEFVRRPVSWMPVLNKAVRSTSDPFLRYLPKQSWSSEIPPANTWPQRGISRAGEAITQFLVWPLKLGVIWPLALGAFGLIHAVRKTRLSREVESVSPLGSMGVFAGVIGLGLCFAAVVGDGYYELEKHVHIASLSFAIQAASAIAIAIMHFWHWRYPPAVGARGGT